MIINISSLSGCKTSCQYYDASDSCTFDSGGTQCAWVGSVERCVSSNYCSGVIKKDECHIDGGGHICVWSEIDGTCRSGLCTEVTTEADCLRDSGGRLCRWINSSLGCYTVPLTCSEVLSNETCILDVNNNVCSWINVKSKGNFCVELPSVCLDAKRKGDCIIDSNETLCEWDEVNSICNVYIPPEPESETEGVSTMEVVFLSVFFPLLAALFAVIIIAFICIFVQSRLQTKRGGVKDIDMDD
jgi:hypothetical protein